MLHKYTRVLDHLVPNLDVAADMNGLEWYVQWVVVFAEGSG